MSESVFERNAEAEGRTRFVDPRTTVEAQATSEPPSSLVMTGQIGRRQMERSAVGSSSHRLLVSPESSQDRHFTCRGSRGTRFGRPVLAAVPFGRVRPASLAAGRMGSAIPYCERAHGFLNCCKASDVEERHLAKILAGLPSRTTAGVRSMHVGIR